VRAADGDERHGPFLPKEGYEDEAQYDSHLSSSPLLKHYLHEYACLMYLCRSRVDEMMFTEMRK